MLSGYYHNKKTLIRSACIINKIAISFNQRQEQTHQRAVYECNERLKVIDIIKQDNVTSARILFYRFLMGYQVERTLDELSSQHNTHIKERELYRQQRQGLLRAYELIPQQQTKLIK